MNQEIKIIAPSKNAFQNYGQKYVCLIKEIPTDDY